MDEKGVLRGALIDLLLGLLVDRLVERPGNFDHYIIHSPDILPLMFGLYYHFDSEMKHQLINEFIPFVENSTLNKSLCCQQNLVILFLEMIAKEGGRDLHLASKLINLVEILGSHSITVPELKLFFQILQQNVKGYRPGTQLLMVRALQFMCSSRLSAPEVFFTFDGMTAGLCLPSLPSFPASPGYSFCTWLRVESFNNPLDVPMYMPQIYSFASGDISFDVYFRRYGCCFPFFYLFLFVCFLE